VIKGFAELHKERRLDTPRVFLYKGKPWENPRSAFAAAGKMAGVDTMTAMKIVGRKGEQMHRRYNTIEPEDLHEPAAKLQRYRANTVITLASSAVSEHIISHCNS